jgi:hypothetical protein
MRIIHLFLVCLLLCGSTLISFAAGGGNRSVRGIAFVALQDHGKTDPKLAPYESILRSNLRFESFRYVGESSASISPGGTAFLSVPGGGRVEIECDKAGNVKAQHGGVVVSLGGKPQVFLDGTSGMIVMLQ